MRKKTVFVAFCTMIVSLALTMPLFGVAETEEVDVSEKIHFLIPGGAGGGWDGTARGTGEALTGSGLLGTASYENLRRGRRHSDCSHD